MLVGDEDDLAQAISMHEMPTLWFRRPQHIHLTLYCTLYVGGRDGITLEQWRACIAASAAHDHPRENV